MEDENLRKLVNGKLLGAFAASLTFGAGGFFIAVEYFFFSEEIQTVLEFDGGTLVGRDGQGEIPEGIKGDAAVPANGALQRRFQLTHEEVDDFGIVPS